MMESPIAMNGSTRRRVLPAPVVALVAIVAVLAIAGGAWLALRSAGSDAGASATRVDPALESAQEAYESGDFAAAESQLSAVVAEDDADLDARKALALALSAQGKNDEALEQYAAVVAADPDDHASLFAMATIEQLTGKSDEAISNLESAIEIEPLPSYLQALAPMYATVGRWDDCIATWQSYLEVGELDERAQAQVHAAIASAYEGTRDYGKAKESLQTALFLDPNNETYKARLEGYGD